MTTQISWLSHRYHFSSTFQRCSVYHCFVKNKIFDCNNILELVLKNQNNPEKLIPNQALIT